MRSFLWTLLFFLYGFLAALIYVNFFPLERNNQRSPALVKIDYLKMQKEVLPEAGFSLPASFGDLGPKLVTVGAIDLRKFEKNFEDQGGLSEVQKEILTQKTNRRIFIDQRNATFMVDFFWALGLSNQNPILDQGPMVNDPSQLGNFASTGGWTLGKKKAVDLYSKFKIIELTNDQQKLVEEIAARVFRPCCNNPTLFPDCNHGMAALGLTQYLVAQGLSKGEIYKALLSFNSFWFPQNYLDLAAFFKINNVDWANLSPQLVLGQKYSRLAGAAWVKKELDLRLGNTLPVGGSGRGCST